MKVEKRKVTEKDLRAPQFQEGEPDDYEFREDGAIVRKDRWERGLRDVAGLLGIGGRFEIEDLLDALKSSLVRLESLDEMFEEFSEQKKRHATADKKGVYPKYFIKRFDGKDKADEKHYACSLFVLDLNHDPFAYTAILGYAEACEVEQPKLADDLRAAAYFMRNSEHSEIKDQVKEISARISFNSTRVNSDGQ